ncbi:cation diffusion facilitator family transporter [Phaeovulum sp.]|uniref:cation diffusion facilitator family transporter n=1 Tax=Phaeovulum sp. TaxID=2934796 RepID=UPI003566D769
MPHDHHHPALEADHGHAPAHGHGHDHGLAAAAGTGPAFRLAVALNLGYLLAEALAGFMTGSLALLADAAHNLTDVAGLLLAWGAAVLARRGASAQYTWGYGRATFLAALGNGTAILVGAGVVIGEALGRFGTPPEVAGGTVALVAAAGIAVNGGTAMLFLRHRAELNARGAFLHMAADAAVSLAVVLAAVLMHLTGARWLDPAVAIAVSLLVAVASAQLLADAARGLMDRVPAGLDGAAIRAMLGRWPGVAGVHDLHLWPISTSRVALSAHLVMPAGYPGDAAMAAIAEAIETQFGVAHATLQVETGTGPGCATGNDCG